MTPASGEIVKRADAMLRQKYTVHADARQAELGLSYITAETSELARTIARFAADFIAARSARIMELEQAVDDLASGKIKTLTVVTLEKALRPFAFLDHPEKFQSVEGGCTDVTVADKQVQAARAALTFKEPPLEPIAAALTKPEPGVDEQIVERLEQRPAFWTHDDEAVSDVGHLYYFGPTNRRPPPYKKQRHVTAIIDIADDGTLAGVELIDDMPPPPLATPTKPPEGLETTEDIRQNIRTVTTWLTAANDRALYSAVNRQEFKAQVNTLLLEHATLTARLAAAEVGERKAQGDMLIANQRCAKAEVRLEAAEDALREARKVVLGYAPSHLRSDYLRQIDAALTGQEKQT